MSKQDSRFPPAVVCLIMPLIACAASPMYGASAAASRPAMFFAVPGGNEIHGNGPGFQVRFRTGGFDLQSGGSEIEVQFVGTIAGVRPVGKDPSGMLRFIRTAQPVEASIYEAVTYSQIYPGIDLVYRSGKSCLKADFIVAPGADPAQVRWRYPKSTVRLEEGALIVRAGKSMLREEAPVVFQETRSGRREIASAYRLSHDGTASVELGPYDRSLPLIIDPEITFSTYWGGNMMNELTGVAAASDGSVYVTGWTESLNVPVQSAHQNSKRGSTDAFVMKLSPARKVVFATYFGGAGADRANAIAVDNSGNAYITGSTSSLDFPVSAGALQRFMRGNRDVFVAKFSPSGSLVYSTYLGGSGADSANGISVDAAGAAYIAGQTNSYNFPVANPYQNTLRGAENAFVSKLQPDGRSLAYSTYLGGGSSDQAYGVATMNGEAFITGATTSWNFPVMSAAQPALKGFQDGFVARFSASGSALVYATFLGGTGGSSSLPEMATAIAISNKAEAWIAGTTSSVDFPLVNAVQRSLAGGGGNDAFVARLSVSGAISYSSYLGGISSDSARAIALTPSGDIAVAGYTASRDFPVKGSLYGFAGLYDAFLVQLDPVTGGVLFGTFFGGSGSDSASGVAVGQAASITLVGGTQSWNLPLRNALQAHLPGAMGGFVATIGQTVMPKHAIGIWRSGNWIIDRNSNRQIDTTGADASFWFGLPGDIPVVGDWDGSGRLRIGVYRDGQWFLDYNGNGQWDGYGTDASFWFGLPGDIPVVGDWDGSGRLRIGIYRTGQWLLDYNGNYAWDGFNVDRGFWFGIPGDIPVVGDWDGSGRLRIGIYRNGEWFVDLNGNYAWDGFAIDRSLWFGIPGDVPVVGDWDGTGRLRIGVYRAGEWFVDIDASLSWSGLDVDGMFTYGNSKDQAIGRAPL